MLDDSSNINNKTFSSSLHRRNSTKPASSAAFFAPSRALRRTPGILRAWSIAPPSEWHKFHKVLEKGGTVSPVRPHARESLVKVPRSIARAKVDFFPFFPHPFSHFLRQRLRYMRCRVSTFTLVWLAGRLYLSIWLFLYFDMAYEKVLMFLKLLIVGNSHRSQFCQSVTAWNCISIRNWEILRIIGIEDHQRYISSHVRNWRAWINLLVRGRMRSRWRRKLQ